LGIDKHANEYYDSQKFVSKSNEMAPKYEIGQKVIIAPVKNQRLSPRDSDIEPYAGQVGEVIDYYWIRPNASEVFYIYTARMETDRMEIALHEDELAPHIE